METISSAPTIKQRRKFERIETSNMNNQDTSSVNHVSDAYAIGKLSKCIHGEVQTLAVCCKESIKKHFLQEENDHRRRLSDLISHSSIRETYLKMNKTLLYVITASPFFIFLIAFSITYTICIHTSPAESVFFYISDTALDYPQSSIAMQSLNIIAITVFLTLFTRHLVLRHYLRDFCQEETHNYWVNVMFWANLLISFSIQIIGNFPAVNVGNITLHFTAVMTFFVCCIGYTIINTMITYHTIDVLSDRRIYYLRFIITMIVLISASAAVIPGLISWVQFNGENYRKWGPNDAGWTCHVISVIGEWAFVIFSNFYVLTLAYEFQWMTFYMPVIKIRYLTIKEKMES